MIIPLYKVNIEELPTANYKGYIRVYSNSGRLIVYAIW